jgi:hypothetical protein
VNKIVTAYCDACAGNRKTIGRQPCLDLGRYRRVCGCTGEVRYLCQHHARGLKGCEAFAEEAGKVKALNATAQRDFRGTCGHAIAKGERLLMVRERALTYAHARHAGTMYPWRKLCATCATAPKAEETR